MLFFGGPVVFAQAMPQDSHLVVLKQRERGLALTERGWQGLDIHKPEMHPAISQGQRLNSVDQKLNWCYANRCFCSGWLYGPVCQVADARSELERVG